MSDPTGTTPYRVLARKYRPSTFAELIGQDAMVRTLRNAFASGRLAHAFILTGVRGVGKTTTARIIARALNCIGPDGKSGPTIEPCGVCPHCIAIADDRHVDVLEMDAASRTGVDDVRELIEGVAYRPVMGRYKVYIVDEVHMLSKPAFNALLKTLEEPPEHVKFVFATTEIRRIPITVLSRCQRFDLRRVPPELLATHLAAVAGREGAALDDGALRLLVRAADGSVRDALSLLDQAIAHGGGRVDGAASVSEDEMRAMLGLADGGQVLELFETVMRGDAADALARIAALYNAGADPMVVIQDLLELTHWLTRIKLAPEADARDVVTDSERARAAALARRLAMPVLARAWQMLLKGVAEVRTAPSAIQAAEMLIVRLCYVADLPTPAELARGGMPASETRAPTRVSESAPSRVSESAPARGEGASALLRAVDPAPDAGPVAAAAPPAPANFRDAVALFARHREAILHAHLVSDVHLVRFEPGRIEFRPGPNAPANLPNRISDCLGRWTARAWLVVSLPAGDGAPSLHEQDEAAEAQRRNAALSHPLVQA
ncbi:MAG: DNA polymerase III subunit gamma/tau, partial [Alphaproteobacteria bacterium]|nr:DNA polymerase III subunit gamma/tau [Alphaproteobacteria bacterium]